MVYTSSHNEISEEEKKWLTVCKIMSLPPKDRELLKAIVEIMLIQKDGYEFKIEKTTKITSPKLNLGKE